MMDHRSQDPDVADHPRDKTKTKWVISRIRLRKDSTRSFSDTERDMACDRCLRETVYASLDNVSAHLRKQHIMDP
jgi:hypothetical protein